MSEITVAVFVNPLAGSGKYRVVESEISRFLIREEIVFVVYDKSWPAKLNQFTHLFVVGGDGTLNYFLNTYPDTKIPISLFKAGSGNDFAWKLNGRNTLNQQLNTGLNGIPQAVDAGKCNGRIFINGVGIGFDGTVVKNLIAARRWLSGNLAYYWTVLQTISAYRSLDLKISFGQKTEEKGAENMPVKSHVKPRGQTQHYNRRSFMVTIANGSRFGGNFMVSPYSSITDNQFDLVIIEAVNVLQRYFYLPRMKKGRHLSLPFVKTYKLQSISIESNKPVAAHLDGELMVASKFDIQVLPGHFIFRH